MPDKTTQEHIEYLSNPKNKLSEVEVANLIVKFTVDYICGFLKIRWYSQPYDLKFLDNILYESQKDIKNSNEKTRIFSLTEPDLTPNKYIKKTIYDIAYQVSMLIDFSKTLEVFLDIASRTINKKDDKYYWLDLWTWSWILLLAQYIQAKRNWFTDENITNIWIELNKKASEISNILANNFWFWNVIYWDTTSPDIIKSLNFPRIDFLSNENLPFPTSKLSLEPFVRNLYNLTLKCWFDLRETEFFPSWVVFEWILKDSTFRFKNPEDLYNFLELANKDKNTKVKYIILNWKKVHLSDIWNKYILKFSNEWFFTLDLELPRRW